MTLRGHLTFNCNTTCLSLFFFFNDTATTEIYTLSLHDALPICSTTRAAFTRYTASQRIVSAPWISRGLRQRSEEHTSELQSQSNLVCRLLLEKKKIYDTSVDSIKHSCSILLHTHLVAL